MGMHFSTCGYESCKIYFNGFNLFLQLYCIGSIKF